jgi:hypothetical protein
MLVGTREFEYVDATKPFTLHVTWNDIKGATPKDFRNCVLSRAVRREHNCYDIVCYKTRAYIRKRENSIPVRYEITGAASDLLITFDASGRAHPITVTFVPPRQTKEKLRSRKMKTARKRSAMKRQKQELENSDIHRRRSYTKPDPLTLWGVRNGSGKKPMARVAGYKS